jgi:flagellar biosynthetic protein FlhB
MGSEDKAERTIRATHRKRRKSAEEGNLPRSREFPNIMTLVVAVFVIFLFGGLGTAALSRLVSDLLTQSATTQLNTVTVTNLFWDISARLGLIVGPLFIALLVTAILGSTLFQGGWNISFKPFEFKPNKFNPAQGLKRMVMSPTAGINFLRTIVIVLIVGWITWDTIMSELPKLPGLTMLPLPQAVKFTADFIFVALVKILILFILVAVLDLGWTHYRYEEDLKMSRREMRDELKMTEGDPMIKRRIRTLQLQAIRRRMMAEVPRADVVITNPTHYAVALAYNPEKKAAPEVLAKGRGLLAQKIREIAEEHGVPLVENPTLAQTLYRTCEVGDIIPPDLYRAVAEVLAYVYKLRNRVPA